MNKFTVYKIAIVTVIVLVTMFSLNASDKNTAIFSGHDIPVLDSFYLDLESGERFDSNLETNPVTYSEEKSEDGIIIDIKQKGIRFNECKYFPESYTSIALWEFNFDYSILEYYDYECPSTLCLTKMFEIPDGIDTSDCTIDVIEYGYKDFNLKIAPVIITANGKPVNLDGITPYSGFKPNGIYESWISEEIPQGCGNLKKVIENHLTQYDYENEVLRAYTHIRLRVNWGSSTTAIKEIAPDNAGATPEYYNLQGVKIANPMPGTICIERRGSHARKVKL